VGAFASLLQRIVPAAWLARLAPLVAGRERVLGIAGAAFAAAVVAVAALWSLSGGYSVLYAGLSSEEGGRTLAELQKLNIPYRIGEGGRVILVPSSEVGRARLQLAARGIPKHESDDWAILDNESLGISPFVEQVHYVRGVEAALSRTIREVDGVVAAKVTLAVPKQTDFLADSAKPSASVLLRLRPGIQLSMNQVDGIVGLVASSVPGLSRDNVTIVDQTGRSLAGDGRAGLGQVPAQLELARAITHRYEALVTDLLVPVLGRGNFRVSADADIDFSQSKESLVKYGQSHVLSSDETIHNRTGEAAGEQAGGIPGALSNRRPDTPVVAPAQKPAADAQAGNPGEAPAEAKPAPPPAVSTDSHKTTNYDIDRTVEYLEHPSWRLRSISLAVLVNNATGKPLPAARIKSVETLVSSAIGAGQNPHVTVVDLPFETATMGGGDPLTPWWNEPWVAAVEQNALLALAGLLALMGGILPLSRRVAALVPAPAAAGRGAGGHARAPRAAATGAAEPADGRALLSEPARTLAAAQDVFSIEAETVQTLVVNDPARTAQVIRGWIAGDRSNLKQAS
jgi:flagellar M-ring protein FliF